MDRRSVVVLLVVLALIALPVFCLAGALEHSCGSCQDSCSHDACAHDPCGTLIRGDDSEVGGIDLPAPLLFAILRLTDAESVPLASSRWYPATRPPPTALPYHASDVPLLI